jgi:hypothetical protein
VKKKALQQVLRQHILPVRAFRADSVLQVGVRGECNFRIKIFANIRGGQKGQFGELKFDSPRPLLISFLLQGSPYSPGAPSVPLLCTSFFGETARSKEP